MTTDRTNRLRVLVVAGHEPWPLDHGGRLRLYNFVRHLADSADVTLAIPDPPRHRNLFPSQVRIVPMTGPSAATNSRSQRLPRADWMLRRVRGHFGTRPQYNAWLHRHARPEHFDVALCSGAAMGQYAAALHIPVVWDAVDELVLYTLRVAETAEPRRRPAALRAAFFQALFERYVARRAAATVFTSSVDASYARRWVAPARVAAISNGVDFDYFAPGEHPPEAGTVAFVGALDFPPNVDGIVHFARGIWPAIYARGPNRRLLVVGRRPAAVVRELAAIPGVELVGGVPDVRPYLRRTTVVVVPTRTGGGVKNKVLEACALARPVVASPRALAGLSARRGRDVLCADRTASWVERVSSLLEHSDAAASLAANGHRWVRRAHHWPALTSDLHRVLQSAARSLRSSAIRLSAREHRTTTFTRAVAADSPATRITRRSNALAEGNRRAAPPWAIARNLEFTSRDNEEVRCR